MIPLYLCSLFVIGFLCPQEEKPPENNTISTQATELVVLEEMDETCYCDKAKLFHEAGYPYEHQPGSEGVPKLVSGYFSKMFYDERYPYAYQSVSEVFQALVTNCFLKHKNLYKEDIDSFITHLEKVHKGDESLWSLSYEFYYEIAYFNEILKEFNHCFRLGYFSSLRRELNKIPLPSIEDGLNDSDGQNLIDRNELSLSEKDNVFIKLDKKKDLNFTLTEQIVDPLNCDLINILYRYLKSKVDRKIITTQFEIDLLIDEIGSFINLEKDIIFIPYSMRHHESDLQHFLENNRNCFSKNKNIRIVLNKIGFDLKEENTQVSAGGNKIYFDTEMIPSGNFYSYQDISILFCSTQVENKNFKRLISLLFDFENTSDYLVLYFRRCKNEISKISVTVDYKSYPFFLSSADNIRFDVKESQEFFTDVHSIKALSNVSEEATQDTFPRQTLPPCRLGKEQSNPFCFIMIEGRLFPANENSLYNFNHSVDNFFVDYLYNIADEIGVLSFKDMSRFLEQMWSGSGDLFPHIMLRENEYKYESYFYYQTIKNAIRVYGHSFNRTVIYEKLRDKLL